jgi:3-oxoacyl-[acyl-carrier-protein] synthase III
MRSTSLFYPIYSNTLYTLLLPNDQGYTADDVDWLLLHQANIRIMEGAAEALGIPMSKVLKNIEEYGNTSAG